MIGKLKKGFKGSVSIYFATIVKSVAAFLLSILMARAFSKATFGNYQLMLSILSVGTILCSLGIEATFMRFGTELFALKKWGSLKQAMLGSMIIRAVALIIFGLVLVLLSLPISKLFNYSPELINLLPLIAVLLFLQSMNRLFGTTFLAIRLDQLHDSYNVIAVHTLKLIGFSLLIWFGYELKNLVWLWIIILLGSAVNYLFLDYRWLKKVIPRKIEKAPSVPDFFPKKLFKRMLRFAVLTFAGENIGIFKNIAVDALLIAHFLGAGAVAVYSVASTLIIIIAQFNPAALLRGVLNPIFVSRYAEKKDIKELIWGQKFLMKIILIFVLPISLSLILVGDQIIYILYSDRYAAAYVSLIYLSAASFFWAQVFSFHALLNTLEKNEIYLLTGFLSIYNLIMDIILIPILGIKGAAIATGSAWTLQFIFYWCAFKWYVKLDIVYPWRFFFRLLLNCLPLIISILIFKQHINSILNLILFIGINVLIYCGLFFINNGLESQERELAMSVLRKRRTK